MQLQTKASAFAQLIRKHDSLWHGHKSHVGKETQQMSLTFEQLMRDIRDSFQLQLSMSEMKRLYNLVMMWYSFNYNTKLQDKRTIPASTEKYLTCFGFLPKTVRRILYCEYCPELLRTANKYQVHRRMHMGGSNMTPCRYCQKDFSFLNKLRLHEEECCLNQQKK